MSDFKSIAYDGKTLTLIDQRVLPTVESYLTYDRGEPLIEAIASMVVRGAPAIGVTAAYAVLLEARALVSERRPQALPAFAQRLKEARPTAVNLMWAVDRMMKTLAEDRPLADQLEALEREAVAIHEEDIATNEAMAAAGLAVVPPGSTVLTHCNTGALATAHLGTAFGVIKKAHDTHGDLFVYADETRPRLQGARLTAFELKKAGIDFALQADGAAAHLMKTKKIDVILVGADRIAANGDTANKIGTLMLAILAKHYNVPFYIVAPTSTVDLSCENGAAIAIEERSSDEIFLVGDERIAPEDIAGHNPAFDVTDADLIAGIITEKGILRPPFDRSLAEVLR